MGPPLYPHFNVGHTLTRHLQHVSSSSLRLSSQTPTLRRGCKGYATIILCKIVSACRCGCCFIRSVHGPFVLRFGTQGSTLDAKFYAKCFPPTVTIRVHLFVLNASPANQLLLSIPPYVYNMASQSMQNIFRSSLSHRLAVWVSEVRNSHSYNHHDNHHPALL